MANPASYNWDASLVKSAVTASLGGSPVTTGASITASVVIPGASVLLKQNTAYQNPVLATASCSPAFAGGPGAGFVWMAYIDDSSVTDQVTVRVTNVTGGTLTPTAGVYLIQVEPS